MTTLAFDGARPRPAPVAAPVAPHGLRRALRAVQRAFVASGQARAQRQMLDFADRCEALQPTLAAELRAASAHIG